jgi:methionyl-tRNA formyltransferase
MKIGIVSNAKIAVPLLSYLSNYYKAGVIFYFGKSAAPDINKSELTGFCNANNIPVHIEDNPDELYQWQQLYDPDIMFFSGYGHKVNIGNLSGVSKGIYNIHFGKLPEFRGPSPVFWQLRKGVTQIGLSIHELTDKLDSGTVVWEKSLKNEDHYSYNYVNQLFSELQVKGVLEILERVIKKQPLTKKIQDEKKAVYYNRPELADIMINWDQMGAKEILDVIKACNSWNNGASTLINGFELKIIDAVILANIQAKESPGTITVTHNSFTVACLKQQVLAVNFFNVNSTFIPARYAGAYGLKTGQKFISTI